MSSLVNYFKRKINPFKRCNVANESPMHPTVIINASELEYTACEINRTCGTLPKQKHAFLENTFYNRTLGNENTSLAKKKRKFNFHMRLKRNMKSANISSGNSTFTYTPSKSSPALRSIVQPSLCKNNVSNRSGSDKSSRSNNSMYTPNASTQSSEKRSQGTASMSYYDDEELTSTTCMTHTATSADLSSPIPSIYSTSSDDNDTQDLEMEAINEHYDQCAVSMKTYNTKYSYYSYDNEGSPNSADDSRDNVDKMINLSKNTEASSPSVIIDTSSSSSQQQSTPFNSSRGDSEPVPAFKKSTTLNPIIVSTASPTSSRGGKRCRRSNTTNTMSSSTRKSNLIIDYFNRLDMQPSANTQRNNHHRNIKYESRNGELRRHLSGNQHFRQLNGSYDSLTDTNESKISVSPDNTASASHFIDSSVDEVEKNMDMFFEDQSFTTNFAADKTASRNLVIQLTEDSMNDTRNTSMEKMRRASMPHYSIKEQDSEIQADVSKIELKNCDEEIEADFMFYDEIPSSSSPHEQSLSRPLHRQASVNETAESFARGRGGRMSTRIKRMFKSVVNQQLNSLANLEKFYESQVALLEKERDRNLDLYPHNAAKIKQLFNRQIELLEERVETNLELICHSKVNMLNQSRSPVVASATQETVVKTNILREKLAQLMMLTKLQQQHQMDHLRAISERNSHQDTVDRSMNRIKSIKDLASHKASPVRNSIVVTDDTFLEDTVQFKRHKSLPFSPKGASRIVTSSLKAEPTVKSTPSPNANSLAYSTSRAKYTKQQQPQFQKNQSLVNKRSSPASTTPQQVEGNSFIENSPLEALATCKILTSNFALIKRQLITNCAMQYKALSPQNNTTEFLNIYRRNSSAFHLTYRGEFNEVTSQTAKHNLPRFSDAHAMFKLNHQQQRKHSSIETQV